MNNGNLKFKAVEAATDVKNENLAIERKLAEDSSAVDVEIGEKKTNCTKYCKKSLPWIIFIIIMLVIGYFIICSNV